jgi:rhodanese-related sulfurtransferase
MSVATIKPRILALLSFARGQERKLSASLTEMERDASGTPDKWSPRERLVSVMRWRELQAEKLALAVRGETPPQWRDEQVVNEINTRAIEQYRDTPFSEVERAAEDAYAALVAQVERMSDEELTSGERYAWADGEALWHETLGNGLMYPFSQMVALSLDRGDRETAAQLQAALVEAIRKADLSADMVGVTLYNAACFYATNGWPERALALLPDALRMRPTLVEWSRHDRDLDCLRDDPRFQALYTDPEIMARAPVSDLLDPRALYESLAFQDSPLVIDVRGPSEYASGHVRGALNIPLGQLARKLGRIPKDRPVVTYCNMHHRGESRGERAATQLREWGYQARTIDGGYPAWKEQGLPVEEA